MAILLQLILLGVFILIGIQIFNAARRGGGRVENDRRRAVADRSSPAKNAAETLREFENARLALKARYPAVFAMLGGYLNAHTLGETGSLEAAVKEMIAGWTPRREEVSGELVRLLAENDSEDEARAIIVAACDATFEQEGYRAWLTWLLGQFNDLK